MLGIDPERILFQNYHLFNINDINHALSFIFFGLLSICIGFYIGENIFPSRRIRPLELINFYKKYPPVNLLTSMLLILLINLYVQVTFGYFVLDNVQFPKWLIRFIGTEWVPALVLFILLTCKNNRIKKYAYLILAIYISHRIFGGSRSAIYYILISYIICNLILYGSEYLITKKTIMALLLITSIGVILFFISTYIRFIRGYSFEDVSSLTTLKLNLDNIISLISARFSAFDSALLIFSEKGYNVDYYYNLKNAILSAINSAFPGKLFPDVNFLHQHYKYVFFNYGYSESISTYNTQYLTIFGEFYLYFGQFGYFIMLLLSSMIIQYIYSTITCSRFSNKIPLIILVLYSYEYFIAGFGIDYFVNFIVGMICSYFMIFILNRLLIYKNKFLIIK